MLRLGVDWIYSIVRGIIAGRILTSESEESTLHLDWTQILPFVDFGDGVQRESGTKFVGGN
jgi:hypothetical protein